MAYLKRLIITGGPWGLIGAQVIEEELGQDNVTPVELPARKLVPEDFPDILGPSLASTIASAETKTADLEAANQTIADRDATIATLEAQVASLNEQLGLQQEAEFPDITQPQLFTILEVQGLLQPARNAIEAMPDGIDKIALRNYFEKSTSYSYHDPKLQGMASELGIVDQLPDLWAAALAV